ncbi:hypothetical protein M8818_000123 [Zalaria obscura]|uniref:Uncharacterized protein n=1 Tax=Zalaria obscura TaxID=2024903 RepID=A0ACC3SP43_9PEZI
MDSSDARRRGQNNWPLNFLKQNVTPSRSPTEHKQIANTHYPRTVRKAEAAGFVGDDGGLYVGILDGWSSTRGEAWAILSSSGIVYYGVLKAFIPFRRALFAPRQNNLVRDMCVGRAIDFTRFPGLWVTVTIGIHHVGDQSYRNC